jgi:hypothetical protein
MLTGRGTARAFQDAVVVDIRDGIYHHMLSMTS